MFTDTDVTIGDDEVVIVVEPEYLEKAQQIEIDDETVGQ